MRSDVVKAMLAAAVLGGVGAWAGACVGGPALSALVAAVGAWTGARWGLS